VRIIAVTVLLLGAWAAGAAPARLTQALPLNRHEPTPAGEPSIMVDVPRYGTDEFSVGFSLNYAHRPLVLGVEDDAGQFQTLRVLIEHQLLGHVDLAARLCDCATFSLTLPIALARRGDSSPLSDSASARSGSVLESLVSSAWPRGPSVGDPRLGFMLRLYGRPDTSPFSASLGSYLWVPLSGQVFRARPMLVLAGIRHRLQWSLVGSYLLQPEAPEGTLPALDGSVEGSELRVGTHVSYTDTARGFAVGPELQFSTQIRPREYAFTPFYTGLEALLGLHLKPTQVLLVQLSAGAGLLRRPGTPDLRLLLRVSYNPVWKHQDGEQAEPPRTVEEAPGGGVQALEPSPRAPSVSEPVPGPVPVPASATPPPLTVEPCGDTSPGQSPGILRLGCPTTDGDEDTVPDVWDACPDKAGAPALEPDRNGCPGLVEVKGDRLLIRQPIVFGRNTDTVQEESLPVLRAMADALRASTWIQKIRIEGHTDNQGSAAFNQMLSVRRARSVMRWLQEYGVDPARLEAAGYGASRPVSGNDTEPGRAANRRVELIIIEPPPSPVPDVRP